VTAFKRGVIVKVNEEHLAHQSAFIANPQTSKDPLQIENVALMQELKGERMKVIGQSFGLAKNWILVQLADNTFRELHRTLLVSTT
jgi:hypothetical protein